MEIPTANDHAGKRIIIRGHKLAHIGMSEPREAYALSVPLEAIKEAGPHIELLLVHIDKRGRLGGHGPADEMAIELSSA
jgi:hypothetical protein